jgi:hypothetical protein
MINPVIDINHLIRQIVILTVVVTKLAGTGSSGSTSGIGNAAIFYGPDYLTTDRTKRYVSN